MLEGYGPVMQAFLGTLFTWALTAAGAALVIVIRGSQRKLLDASLGFAAGVMTAASFWSLLNPAIEMATESKIYGQNGEYAFLPVAFGFLLGAIFVYGADKLITVLGIHSPNMMLALHATSSRKESKRSSRRDSHISCPDTTAIDGFIDSGGSIHQRRRVGRPFEINVRKRFGSPLTEHSGVVIDKQSEDEPCDLEEIQRGHWKRIVLLVVAITVHNIPEGLAVGVGFGAIGTSPSATFERAR
ncbi:unnamed protein product [Callosobruchus maculatus]|uniref:Zinc transporter ZIP11 n=1 Tax=Callosobruchus maculatus TaxID=64391 RepID=A0A653BUH0_CALMS|nr:unnamed protein product [Callosobruchus maculatus]